jgi:MoxR-like ATPase
MRRTTTDPRNLPQQILTAVSQVVVGKEEVKSLLLTALLCGGHVLIEGMAGTAKTLLSKSFALAMGGAFKRVQLTADLLPTDVTGFNLYAANGSSKFIAGPIFAHIVLADELNRTTPRTQAAFLEAMQEHQVTIEGVTHDLPQPFMVIASQLPVGGPGTYPLSDVQSDRFMFRAWSGYPTLEEEAAVISHIDELEEPDVKPVASPEAVLGIRNEVKKIFVSPDLQRYAVSLVDRIRRDTDVAVGPSPRATIALHKGGRAQAYLDGRDYVIPDDIKQLALPAMLHRVHLRSEAELDGVSAETVIRRALDSVPVPKAQA